jgi:acyl-coenzyme A synthetase/AMP-(fatty) acid ligase
MRQNIPAVNAGCSRRKGSLFHRFPGAKASGESLIAHCRQQLASYKVPRAVQFVDAVPMTPSGKIMRRMLNTIDDGTRGEHA